MKQCEREFERADCALDARKSYKPRIVCTRKKGKILQPINRKGT